MYNITFLSNKFHFYSMIICLIVIKFASLILFLLFLIIYFLILFLFRTGKQESIEVTKNDNYIDNYVYSPVFGEVLNVSKNSIKNIVKIRVPFISIRHSWSLSSPVDQIIKYFNYNKAEKKIDITGKTIVLSVKSRLLKPFVLIAVGDRVYSRAMLGYMPFGGIIEIELPRNYEVLIKSKDNLVRGKTVIAKL